MESMEISEELMKELGINSIDEYNEYVKDSNAVSKNEKTLKKKKEKEQKISKTKQKEILRKKEQIMKKRQKNAERSNIIKSLEEQKKKFENILENKLNEMDSMKNLGKKRTNEKKLRKNDINDDDESESSSSFTESDEENNETNENNDIKDEEIDKTTVNSEKNSNSNDLDLTVKEQIIAYLKAKNINAELYDNIEEEINLNLAIPNKETVKIVQRKEEIQSQRINLPIIKYEQEIIDKINKNLVTIICGETGSGKSTQVCQFLYEAGYTNAFGKIIITQPRRVAASSLAKRVSEELNTRLGDKVGYKVRYDTQNVSTNTDIQYVTDGILLKELESDKLLLNYSVVMIDEAHERTINSDIIIGLLSKIIKIRYLLSKNSVKVNGNNVYPLRLIIMSATMRVDEFLESSIFNPKPAFMKVEARTYPVTVHHSKITNMDYNEEAFKTILKIHKRLPYGGILVFLTGKKEINDMCLRLKNYFENDNFNEELEYDNDDENIDEIEIEENEDLTGNVLEKEIIIKEENENNYKNENNDDMNVLDDNFHKNTNTESFKKQIFKPLILPLYSSLEPSQQNLVFEQIPEDTRLIVIATNVAETSITIPNIRYVVDCGREKKRTFKNNLSFSTFNIHFTSKASAEQRSGRAGRTGPGHCYRLYSNGLYAKMDDYSPPQIMDSPLDQILLYLKSIKISNVKEFPFITKPDAFNIERALNHLENLGAIFNVNNYIRESNINRELLRLNNNEMLNEDYKITELGKVMIKFPVSPKFSKMIVLAKKLNLIEYTLLLVSLMNVENLIKFNNNNNNNNDNNENFEGGHLLNLRQIIPSDCLYENSDLLSIMNLLIKAFKEVNKSKNSSNQVLNSLKISQKGFKEVKDLFNQLKKLCEQLFKINLKELHDLFIPKESYSLLSQIIFSGFIENIARKREIFEKVEIEGKTITKKRKIWENLENDQISHIHPSSLLTKTNIELIVYKEIISDKKSFLYFNTAISPEWLFHMGGNLVSYNLENKNALITPKYNKLIQKIMTPLNMLYGHKRWEFSNIMVELDETKEGYFNWLARFFIQGDLYEDLKIFTKYLNSAPSIITDQLSISSKVVSLVNSIKNLKIVDKNGFQKEFLKNKQYLIIHYIRFLLGTYLLWFDNEKVKKLIKTQWPPKK